jgi:hypothetical protein
MAMTTTDPIPDRRRARRAKAVSNCPSRHRNGVLPTMSGLDLVAPSARPSAAARANMSNTAVAHGRSHSFT